MNKIHYFAVILLTGLASSSITIAADKNIKNSVSNQMVFMDEEDALDSDEDVSEDDVPAAAPTKTITPDTEAVEPAEEAIVNNPEPAKQESQQQDLNEEKAVVTLPNQNQETADEKAIASDDQEKQADNGKEESLDEFLEAEKNDQIEEIQSEINELDKLAEDELKKINDTSLAPEEKIVAQEKVKQIKRQVFYKKEEESVRRGKTSNSAEESAYGF